MTEVATLSVSDTSREEAFAAASVPAGGSRRARPRRGPSRRVRHWHAGYYSRCSRGRRLLLHLVRDQKLDIHDSPSRDHEQYRPTRRDEGAEHRPGGGFPGDGLHAPHISRSRAAAHEDEAEEEEDPEIPAGGAVAPPRRVHGSRRPAPASGSGPVLGRDVFVRDFLPEEIPRGSFVITELSMADLITAFRILAGYPREATRYSSSGHHRHASSFPPGPLKIGVVRFETS